MDKRNDGELVFAAPSYVGEIAERARRVEELEQIIAKKDEHIQKVADLIVQAKSIWPHMSSTLDTMYFWVINALSLTPASVAKEVEDARVGRVVEEWLDVQGWVDRVVFADTGGLHVMLNELREVIAKAREG